jgi:hypothetical protein
MVVNAAEDLELLAGTQRGCSEAILMAHDFPMSLVATATPFKGPHRWSNGPDHTRDDHRDRPKNIHQFLGFGLFVPKARHQRWSIRALQQR